jgi:hypothetical protein
MGLQVIEGDLGNLLLFGGRHSRLRYAKFEVAPRLDFNEHNLFSLLSDQVNLAETGTVILGANLVSLRFEVFNCECFADFPDLYSRVAHFTEV